jgi:hypothetical protein
MDVFLVPIGADRHELYCEVAVADLTPASDGTAVPVASWWRTRVDRFRHLLAEAEDERRRRERGETVESAGAWRWVMRKVAEAIAEQRLLWMLRKQSAAALVYPSDQSADRALQIAKASLQRDFEKHRRWLVIDGLLMLLCLPLTVIPGPNVPSLFFSFRAIGHYFSLRGARCGLSHLVWEARASPELTQIRGALSLAPSERRTRVEFLAAQLGLERLGLFVERVTG